MKNQKNLTREMKKILSKEGFNAKDWKYIKNENDRYTFVKNEGKVMLIIRKD